MDENKILLNVNRLRIEFGGTSRFAAVRDISFQVKKGSTLAVVGESGSGKSLTALSLMGLLPQEAHLSGTIDFKKKDRFISLTGNPRKDAWQSIRGKEISMVFQEPMSSLNPVMKIGKQLSEAIRAHQEISQKSARIQALEWLQKVRLPEVGKIYERYPHQLSGGQKQRVMIAMAMCNCPDLLIADEPTTALDVTVQKEIILLMRRLRDEYGTAMIFVTHDLALASEIADEVIVLFRGEIMEQGAISEVLNHPEHPYTRALLACRPSPEHKGKRLLSVEDFLKGEKTQNTAPESIVPEPDYATPVLEVRDLKVWFEAETNWLGKPLNYFKAVENVSFNLFKGEVLGLVGESGCGKSSLSKSLLGLIPTRDGQILFQGKDLAKCSKQEWQQVRKDIQMIFQDPFSSLNPRNSIGEMLMEPMRVHGLMKTNNLKREALRLLDLVHLPSESFEKYPHQFSGGQKQRLGIARALSLRPKLIICDESVSALDVSVQAQILNLLKDLQLELGLSYLFISHDLSVVHFISDRVMVMQQGRIVEKGRATQVLKNPAHPYTRKLVAAIPKGNFE